MATNYYSRENAKTIQENLRNAKGDYDRMKTSVMQDIYEYLKDTKKAFTASELSAKFGLSIPVITNNLVRCFNHIRTSKRYISKEMVYLDENGKPDMSHIVTKHRRVNEYFYQESSSLNRYGYW